MTVAKGVQVHDVEFDQDEDGWDIARCDCGWVSPPCPGKSEAAGFWGDHKTIEEAAAG